MTKPVNNLNVRRFGVWEFDVATNKLRRVNSDTTVRLEPKVGELLFILIEANGQVLTKQTLLSNLWNNTVVGDDTLARTVSRLRNVLSDSASAPIYVETIPKKGYRFKAKVLSPRKPSFSRKILYSCCILTVFCICALATFAILQKKESELDGMLARADGLYMAFEEQSNESALALYEAVLEIAPENPQARAGIANAMVQRLVRWPAKQFSVEASEISLTNALKSGQLDSPESRLMLERARLIAQKAVRQAPNDADSLKSLGFVYSAEGKIDKAIEQYQRAISLNENAWRSMINLGELYFLNEQDSKAIDAFVNAYEAMEITYSEEPQNVGPWQPEVGNLIAKHYLSNGQFQYAQVWAEQVLSRVPFHREATEVLVHSLLQNNEIKSAQTVCDRYASKLKPLEDCKQLQR